MHKKYLLLLLALLNPCNFSFASSTLKITQIMYDLPGSDDNREWIEIENTGDADIDLTGWKLDVGDGVKHGLNVPPKNGGTGSMILPPGNKAIIADDASTYLSENSAYAGTLIDSSFSLNNTGATVQILDQDGNQAASLDYSSASDPAAPEDPPAPEEPVDAADDLVDTEVEAPPPVTGGGGRSVPTKSSELSAASVSTKIVKPKTPTLKIIAPKVITAKSPLALSADRSDYSGSENGKFVWNFGNGDVRESTVKDINYTYNFTGNYTITLNYYADAAALPLKAKLKIKVEENPIIISSASEGNIELKNKAAHEIDVSGWILNSGERKFSLPPETVLSAGASIILPRQTTQLNSDDNVALLYPSGENAFNFQAPKIEEVKKEKPKIVNNIKPIISDTALVKTPENEVKPEVKGAELQASAVAGLKDVKNGAMIPWFAGLGGIVVLSSALSIYLLPKKMISKLTDFTIVD